MAKRLKNSDMVDVDVDQSVQITHDFDLSGFENVVFQTTYRETTQHREKTDIDIRSEGGDIDGALVDVVQHMDIDQYAKVVIRIREKGDQIIVKTNIVEKTKVVQNTDVDVLLLQDDRIEVNTVSRVDLDQTYDTKIVVKGADDIDVNLSVSQSSWIEQAIEVNFLGTRDDFTIDIDADQDAVLSQVVSLAVLPLETFIA